MKIVAVQKEGNYISAIKLEDGRAMTTQEAIDLIVTNQLVIDDVMIVQSKEGLSYFRSMQDGKDGNNLNNLPHFSLDGTERPMYTNPHNANPGDAKSIVAVKRDGTDITAYKLSDGTVLGEQEAVSAVRNGVIEGYTIGSRNGQEYIRSYPDNNPNNNLGNLPEF